MSQESENDEPKFKVLEVIPINPSTIYKIPIEWDIKDIFVRYDGVLHYKGKEVDCPSESIDWDKKFTIQISDYDVDDYFDCEEFPHAIYILSDGATWSTECEIRKATKTDVKRWQEYDLTKGQIICCVGDDFEIDDTITVLQITDEELERLQQYGLEPRKLDNYYERVTSDNKVKKYK